MTQDSQTITAEERLRQVEAELTALKEAVKPFALCVNKWAAEGDDLKMEIVWWKPVTARGPLDFYLSDLRRLSRAALNQGQG